MNGDSGYANAFQFYGLYVHCLSCLVLVYRLQTLAQKKFFYSLERQMEGNTRPVARVIVCLNQESIAKLSYLLYSRVSVLVARKNLGA